MDKKEFTNWVNKSPLRLAIDHVISGCEFNTFDAVVQGIQEIETIILSYRPIQNVQTTEDKQYERPGQFINVPSSAVITDCIVPNCPVPVVVPATWTSQEIEHPLSGLHINQGSMDTTADAYEAEFLEHKCRQQYENTYHKIRAAMGYDDWKVAWMKGYRTAPVAAQDTQITDGRINEITMDSLGKWPSFDAQSWACKVVHAVLAAAPVAAPVQDTQPVSQKYCAWCERPEVNGHDRECPHAAQDTQPVGGRIPT